MTQDGTTLWDTATWRPTGPPLRSSQGGWEGVDFSPDGRTLAIAGGEGRVELWDVSTRKELRELTDPAAASSDEPALSVVRYSPDGSVIAAGAQQANHVTLWAAASGQVIGRPITTNPPGRRRTLDLLQPGFEADRRPGRSRDGRDLEGGDGAPGRTAARDRERKRGGGDLRRGGRTLIASDDSGSVSIVDIRTGRSLGPPLSVGSEPAGSLDLSPDGRLLAAASYEGSVFVWDVKTGTPYGSPLIADTSPLNDVAFSPDGRTLVSSHLRSAVVWNMSGEQAIGKPLGDPTDVTTDVSFSPDGKRLVVGRFDGGAIVYDTATRRQALRIDVGSVVTAVAFAPDGKLIAMGTIDGQGPLLRCERPGRPSARPLDVGNVGGLADRASAPTVGCLRWPWTRTAWSGFYGQQRQGKVQLWDVDSRSRVGRQIAPGGGSVLSLAFSRDGKLLATGSRGQLDLWDVATQARHGKPMRVADDGFPSVAFDPSGRLVAAGGGIGPVRVWRVADQRPAFPPLSGHTGPSPGRRSTRPARSSQPRACSAEPGCGTRPRVSATATSWSEARGPARSCRRSIRRSWRRGTHSARMASCSPSRGSKHSRCCGMSTRRSGAGVPARSSAET